LRFENQDYKEKEKSLTIGGREKVLDA
jgi:hypothetical protein